MLQKKPTVEGSTHSWDGSREVSILVWCWLWHHIYRNRRPRCRQPFVIGLSPSKSRELSCIIFVYSGAQNAMKKKHAAAAGRSAALRFCSRDWQLWTQIGAQTQGTKKRARQQLRGRTKQPRLALLSDESQLLGCYRIHDFASAPDGVGDGDRQALSRSKPRLKSVDVPTDRHIQTHAASKQAVVWNEALSFSP